MTKEEFRNLQPGDIIQHVEESGCGGHTWLVSANYGGKVTLVETCEASIPEEWEIVIKQTPEIVCRSIQVEGIKFRFDLTKFTDNELLGLVCTIISKPGDISNSEKAELDQINSEFRRRAKQCK